MALERAKRVFIIETSGGRITEDDPIPGGSVLEAKKILSGKHPSITNAVAEGPNRNDKGELEYVFAGIAGGKG